MVPNDHIFAHEDNSVSARYFSQIGKLLTKPLQIIRGKRIVTNTKSVVLIVSPNRRKPLTPRRPLFLKHPKFGGKQIGMSELLELGEEIQADGPSFPTGV